MNEDFKIGKIDFLQKYGTYYVCIIKGEDGKSYAASVYSFKRSEQYKIYKGRKVCFTCIDESKIASKIRII